MTAPDAGLSFLEVSHNAHKYRDKFVVIKFGGELVAQEEVMRNLLVQAVTLKNFGARVVLVHGGGAQINQKLKDAGIEPKFDKASGVRDTDLPTLRITHACLQDLNQKIVGNFALEAEKHHEAATARGMGGVDEGLIIAKPKFPDSRTGTVTHVFVDRVEKMAERDVLIFHPICKGLDGDGMNVNADDVAAALAIALKAERLIICSNTPGVLDMRRSEEKNFKKLTPEQKEALRINKLSPSEAEDLIAEGVITDGMIPKIRALVDVVNKGVKGAVTLDGADPHAIERELFSDNGAGTLILQNTGNAVQRHPGTGRQPG